MLTDDYVIVHRCDMRASEADRAVPQGETFRERIVFEERNKVQYVKRDERTNVMETYRGRGSHCRRSKSQEQACQGSPLWAECHRYS
jgi:hypothetical protein